MQEELEVLKGYVESLGLHEKEKLTLVDKHNLVALLEEADEIVLANYVDGLADANELQDLIVNTLLEM